MSATIAHTDDGLWARLGWRALRRPTARVAYVLGAASGALATVAAVALVVEIGSDDLTAPGVLIDGALFVAAAVLGALVAGPTRSAAVTVMVLTTPLVWGFALAGGGFEGRGDARGIYLLTLVTYAVLYLLAWTRGRAVFLGALLAVFTVWVLFEVSGDSATIVPFQTSFETPISIDTTPGLPGSDTNPFEVERQDNTTETAVVALVIGLALVGIAALLDRRDRLGTATPFLAVGIAPAVIGALVLGVREGAALGGVLAMLAGAAIAAVGALGDGRRGSIWLGVLTVFGGAIAVITDIAGDSTLALAAISAVAAVAIAVAAHVLGHATREVDDDTGEGIRRPPALARRAPSGPVV